MIYGVDTFDQLDALERGQEVIYKAIRTQVVWTHKHPATIFVVLQNGAVISMKRGEDRPVRTFPAFGECTRLKFGEAPF